MAQDLSRFDRYDAPAEQAAGERMKEIRLCVGLSDVDKDEVPLGSYYMMDYSGGKDAPPKIENLGPEIRVQMLRHSMKVKKWVQDENKFTMDSSEFRSFQDVVILYDIYSIPTRLVAVLPYQHRNKDLPQIGGKGENSIKKKLGLTVKHVMYVFFRGEVCVMNYTSTDNSGADADDKPLTFGEEAPDSFLGMLSSVPEELKRRLFLCTVLLGSKKHVVGQKPDGTPKYSPKLILRTFKFESAVEEPQVQDMIFEELNKLYAKLSDQMWRKFTAALEATPKDKLDKWSLQFITRLLETGSDPLLYSKNDALKVLPAEGQVLDMQAISGPSTAGSQAEEAEDVAAELGGEAKSVSEPGDHPVAESAASEVVDIAAEAGEILGADAPAETGNPTFRAIVGGNIAKAPKQAGGDGAAGEGEEPGGDGGKGGVRGGRKPRA